MPEGVVIALIASGQAIILAMLGRTARHARSAAKELEGNGSGTMLHMVENILKGQGALQQQVAEHVNDREIHR